MVLTNTIPVRVAVAADDVATQIRLCPVALLLCLSMLVSLRRMCQAAEVFIFGGDQFDLLHERCVGGGEKGNCGGEFLKHRLFVGGGVGQVIKIALEFFILDGFSI